MCNKTIQIFYCGCIPFAPRVRHCKAYKEGKRTCEPTLTRKWLYIDCLDHQKDPDSFTPNATAHAVQSLLSEVEKAKAKDAEAAEVSKSTQPKRIETMEQVIERGRLYVRKMSSEKRKASESATANKASGSDVKAETVTERRSAGYWTQEDGDHSKKVRRGSKKCVVM